MRPEQIVALGLFRYPRSPKIALPTRTWVAPNRMAAS
jgi:hypothetical protein